jgi:hypothetical protein
LNRTACLLSLLFLHYTYVVYNLFVQSKTVIMPVFSGILKATIEKMENDACGTIFDTTYSMKSPSCHKKRKAKEPNEVPPLSAVVSTPTVASIEASGNEVSPLSAVASTPTVASIEASGNEVSPLSAVASTPTVASIEATDNEESPCGTTCERCRYGNMMLMSFDMYKKSPEGQNSKDANRVPGTREVRDRCKYGCIVNDAWPT